MLEGIFGKSLPYRLVMSGTQHRQMLLAQEGLQGWRRGSNLAESEKVFKHLKRGGSGRDRRRDVKSCALCCEGQEVADAILQRGGIRRPRIRQQRGIKGVFTHGCNGLRPELIA